MASRLAGTQLYVVDYRRAAPNSLQGRIYTDNCAALRDEQAILVNEAYLLESEAAMRSFALAGELLASLSISHPDTALVGAPAP